MGQGVGAALHTWCQLPKDRVLSLAAVPACRLRSKHLGEAMAPCCSLLWDLSVIASLDRE